MPAFIQSTKAGVNKVRTIKPPVYPTLILNILQLATLGSFALYFDTDAPSVGGLPAAEAATALSNLVRVTSAPR
jgi:hypothetical protein